MIIISGNQIDYNVLSNQYPNGSLEERILNKLYSSQKVYRYNTVEQLYFEIKLRKSIIDAAIALNRSRFSFETFRSSKCNEDYWHRTNEGGFLLKPGIRPSDAIKDIYINSEKYGTECATAMVIIYYKAIVDIYPEELFNRMFTNIYLMNWQHLDWKLGIRDYTVDIEFLPGDCLYFKNPDVNPLTPEWQGENVIDLGNGKYYGHGIGIGTAKQIIDALNKNRVEGSQISAYLLEEVKRPNFNYLASQYYSFIPMT